MEAPSLAYLAAHPTAIGIGATHPALLLCALAGVAFFLWPYSRAPHIRTAIGTLRAAAVACVAFALAGVHITVRVPDDRIALVAAVDTSASIDDGGRRWSRRFIEKVASHLAPNDSLAVVTFSAEPALAQGPGAPEPLAPWPESAPVASTDVSRAIDAAMALFPSDGDRRLLLVTDGNETRGDAGRQAPWLRAAGVRVDAVVPPHSELAGVRVEKVVAPPVMAADSAAAVRVIVNNPGPARPAVLNLYVDGKLADSAAVQLEAGRGVLVRPTRVDASGSHRLRAEVRVNGITAAAGGAGEVGINVRPPTRVLLLAANSPAPLVEALRRQGLAVEPKPPAALRDVQSLRPYHAIVLEDLAAADLSAGALGALATYVRDLGGGLVVAGGSRTFGDTALASTPLARLLPVTIEPNPRRPGRREPLALFLVIDRSNSMGYNSRIPTLRDGEKLRYAKEAALAVVHQMKDQDLVGVIAFDTKPHEIAALAPLADNRRSLEELLPRLVESGGTDFFDAIVAARAQLGGAPVNRRHIVLITDGDTNRAQPEEYRTLTRQLAADQITVTTIRIGDNTVNLRLLQDISANTSGVFHYVEDAARLPELLLRETALALAPLAPPGERYYPRGAARSQALRGIDGEEFPSLGGYAFSRPKPGADVLVDIARHDRHDPLLAVWRDGLGRVAAFTASPGEDAEQWAGWTAYGKFWSQLVRWTAREHTEEDFAIEARRVDGATEIAVRTFSTDADGAALFGRLRLGDGNVREFDLVPGEPRVFTARLTELTPGTYPLTLVMRTPAGAVSQHSEPLAIPAAQETDGEFTAAPNLSLLAHLTGATGGRLDPPAATLAERAPGLQRAIRPLEGVFLPLAMLFFLADVALRKYPPRAPVSPGRRGRKGGRWTETGSRAARLFTAAATRRRNARS